MKDCTTVHCSKCNSAKYITPTRKEKEEYYNVMCVSCSFKYSILFIHECEEIRNDKERR